MKTKYKRSKQRERILDFLKESKDHPTAAEIFKGLQEEFPDLSMGTVYRNLTILIEQELVKKIDFGSTFDRFEAKIDDHYHFICESCGSVYDLEVPIDTALNEKIDAGTGFTIKWHRIEYYGVCDKCR